MLSKPKFAIKKDKTLLKLAYFYILERNNIKTIPFIIASKEYNT